MCNEVEDIKEYFVDSEEIYYLQIRYPTLKVNIVTIAVFILFLITSTKLIILYINSFSWNNSFFFENYTLNGTLPGEG